MNERIKALRKHLKISQDAFGKRIGISGASVSRLESGENEPSQQTISFICKEFNVSEDWLRGGIGTMYERKESAVDKLVKKFNFPEIVGKLLYTYDQLEESEQEVILDFARRFIATMIREDSSVVASAIAVPDSLSEKESRDMISGRMKQEELSASKIINERTA